MFKFLEKEEKTFLGKCANIALAYFINVIWVVGILKIYKWVFELNYQFIYSPYKRPEIIEFIGAVIMAPLIEEILFRHAPLQYIKATDKKKLLIPTMLFTSVVFGLVHQGGAWSVPIQGVGGFLIACVYVKNGYSYWSAVATHCLWNLSLVSGILNI